MFSIIIPTCNRKHLLIDCLVHLEKSIQYAGDLDVEVIVTNDGVLSEKDIQELKSLLSCVTIVVEGPKKGPAANRNNGAKHAKGDWLIFLDDDVVPDQLLLKEYQCGITKYPNAGAFEGAIHPDDWVLLNQDLAECPVNTTGNCFWSANIMIRREIFEQVGGFDEQFKIAAQEDQDLFIRLNQVTNIPFIQNAIVVHAVRKFNVRKHFLQLRSRAKNLAKYTFKHKNRLKYYNPIIFSLKQFHFYGTIFLKNFRVLKLKSALFFLSRIIIEVPFNIFYFTCKYFSIEFD